MLCIKNQPEVQIFGQQRAKVWQKMRQLEEFPGTKTEIREERVNQVPCLPFLIPNQKSLTAFGSFRRIRLLKR